MHGDLWWDSGANAGRDNKADLIALDWYERNLRGHALSVCPHINPGIR